jgi:hypothetical protein
VRRGSHQGLALIVSCSQPYRREQLPRFGPPSVMVRSNSAAITYMQSRQDDFARETPTRDRTFTMAGIAPRPQPMRTCDRWTMAIPVVFALLIAVSFGLFGASAVTAAPRAAAEFASPSSQITQSTASATKSCPDWQSAFGAGPRGPDHICDNCGAHHGGVYHPDYCHDCIDKGEAPVRPDYGHHHRR